MSSAAKTYVTPEQYLEMERQAERKHEYDRGRIIAMPGASREHNLIAVNIMSELWNQLVERPCEAYAGNMRVRLGEGGPYVYPDVVVVCGEPRFEVEGGVDTLQNPTLIVEVLSPSTEGRDRGRKSRVYRALPSLRHYVMVAQDEVLVEHYRRVDGKWEPSELVDIDATLRLESVDCELPLRRVYAKVAFPETPPV